MSSDIALSHKPTKMRSHFPNITKAIALLKNQNAIALPRYHKCDRTSPIPQMRSQSIPSTINAIAHH
ncbi:hypothetical protein [Nostoc sp.]|uniref:hypothetical protein n=1 Tax=Nostoc sp. TaxID=1180 RepID=UPI002FF85206